MGSLEGSGPLEANAQPESRYSDKFSTLKTAGNSAGGSFGKVDLTHERAGDVLHSVPYRGAIYASRHPGIPACILVPIKHLLIGVSFHAERLRGSLRCTLIGLKGSREKCLKSR